MIATIILIFFLLCKTFGHTTSALVLLIKWSEVKGSLTFEDWIFHSNHLSQNTSFIPTIRTCLCTYLAICSDFSRQTSWSHSSHPHCFMQHSIGVVQVLPVSQICWMISCKTSFISILLFLSLLRDACHLFHQITVVFNFTPTSTHSCQMCITHQEGQTTSSFSSKFQYISISPKTC